MELSLDNTALCTGRNRRLAQHASETRLRLGTETSASSPRVLTVPVAGSDGRDPGSPSRPLTAQAGEEACGERRTRLQPSFRKARALFPREGSSQRTGRARVWVLSGPGGRRGRGPEGSSGDAAGLGQALAP